MNILMSSNSPTQQRSEPEPYQYPVIANYEDLIEDIDGQNKRVQIYYAGIESQGRLTVHEFKATPIDQFFMEQSEIDLSVMESMYLVDYKVAFQL
jgi:hypothetical protein